jgi:hypothetical protein
MAQGWKSRQKARDKVLQADKPDIAAAAAMVLIELGWEPAGKTSTETVHTDNGGAYSLGGRNRFKLPGSPRLCTIGKRTTCFYKLDGNLAPIDMMNVATKDLGEVRRVAVGRGLLAGNPIFRNGTDSCE